MKEFNGKLGLYKIVLTEDNSETLWSEFFDENCHNTSGAIAETFHNYINGCNVLNKLQNNESNELNVLDVGFGPGIGLLALVEVGLRFKSKTINYYSIELDPELVKWSLRNTFNNIAFTEIESGELSYFSFQIENVNASIFIGDGRKTIPKAFDKAIIKNLDVIFQDAFSPKKNPTLWTVEWFSLLKNISKSSVSMATYSSSVSIRKSMREAGFQISSDKGFGRKRTMTKANLIGQTSEELTLELSRSPINAIFDNDLKTI